uniref:Uncharacterized protein n=1 Tax=Ditylenchus dipsaci TaxID=166011 RepID=A0A915DFV3_9BILA
MQIVQAAMTSESGRSVVLNLSGSQQFLCTSNCPNCHERSKRLDMSPRLLVNELTGELKQVPAFAVHQYLNKWSLWHELTNAETKRILADKQHQPMIFSSISSHSPNSLLSSQSSFASSYSLFGGGSGNSVDFNAVVMKALC